MYIIGRPSAGASREALRRGRRRAAALAAPHGADGVRPQHREVLISYYKLLYDMTCPKYLICDTPDCTMILILILTDTNTNLHNPGRIRMAPETSRRGSKRAPQIFDSGRLSRLQRCPMGSVKG